MDGVHPVAADLLDPASLRTALQDVRPTHVFLTTWMRQATEAENIKVNGTTKVICGGIQAQNARIYIIDTVLMPPTS